MSSSGVQAVIFDLDGTMINSEAVAFTVWQQALRTFGCELDEAQYLDLVGQRLDVALLRVREMFGLTLSSEALLRRIDPLWQQATAAGLPLMPGLTQLLARLQLPWGVATATSRADAERILRQLDLWPRCQALAGGDEVLISKPAPDVYLLCADRLGVAPTSCLAIEDSVPGHLAAGAAGMTVIAVPNRWSNPALYTAADYIFDSLHEVEQQLDAILMHD